MAKATLVSGDGEDTVEILLPPPITITAESDAPTPEQPTGEAPRKRGRPKGGGSSSSAGDKPSKSKARKATDLTALAKQIQGLHFIAALGTGIPELQIQQAEAEMLAKGIDAVSEEYGLALDGKTGAAIQLLGAAALVYIPRVLAVKARVEKQKKAAEENDATPLH